MDSAVNVNVYRSMTIQPVYPSRMLSFFFPCGEKQIGFKKIKAQNKNTHKKGELHNNHKQMQLRN